MNKELMMRRLLVAVAVVFIAGAAFAVSPIPPYTVWPCDPNAPEGDGAACSTPDPNDCYSYRSYSPSEALQHRTGNGRSPRSTDKPVAPYGICSGFHQWCSIAPEIGAATYAVIQNPDGGRDVLFNVEYDFPNNYCQVYDDGPPCYASVFPPYHVIEIPPVRLMLVDAATNAIIHSAPAVFEAGTWKPRISIGCDDVNRTYRVIALAGGGVGQCTAKTAEKQVKVEAPAAEPNTCNADKWCPDCSGFPSGAAGKPIALGSGDISVEQPLFSISQSPMPLSFGLTYHSERPIYPHLVDYPLGLGWSHTFNDTLRPVDQPFALTLKGTVLYRHDGKGHETQYEGRPGGPWFPVSPAELRRREWVELANDQFILRDRLNGTITRFSVATGRWHSTTDRWGNTISAIVGPDGHLAGVRDSVGREIVFTTAAGLIGAITLPTGKTWRFEHGTSLAAIYDPMHTGATPWRSYEYTDDRKGRTRLLTAARDEAGKLLEGHDYDAQERGITSYSEGGRDMVRVTYVGPGRTKVATTIDGGLEQQAEYTMRYKGGRWMPTKIVGSCTSCSASSDMQSFVVDDLNRVTSHTEGTGHVTKITYDYLGNVLTRIDAFGTPKVRTTRYQYGHPTWRSFATRIDEPSAAKPGASKITTFTWNANETVLTRTESGWLSATDAQPVTHVSTTTYDTRHRFVSGDGPRTDVADVSSTEYYPDDDADVARRGRMRKRTNAAGHEMTLADYDIYGTARRVVDANGVVTTMLTDARGRSTSTTNHAVAGDANEAADYTSTTEYDGRDRVVLTTAPRGNATRYVYEDATDRLTSTVRLDMNGNEVERHHLTLNDVGGKAGEEDQICVAPSATCAQWQTRRSTSYVYDKHNRLTEVRHDAPAGAKTVYTYDADGLLVATQDENHTTPNTRYTYDARDRLASVTQTLATAPGGVAITRYDYDSNDNLIAVTDPNGNVTRYVYDDFGRMTRQESPVTGVTTYDYDAASNLVSSTDARGATTARTYDALGRVLESTATLGSSVENITFTYDDPTPGRYGIGRLALMTDPSGSTSYDYERRGLLRRETKTILGDTYVIGYAYDANGNRSGLTYPSGRKLTYEFDHSDRPRAVSGTLGGVTTQYISSATYEPFGPLANLRYGNGLIERRATYDSRYRITSLDVIANNTPLAAYRYGYDATGNITSIANALDPRYNRSFGYDDLNRLTSSTTGSALWGSAKWTYDAMGNRLAETLGGKTQSLTYEGSTPKLVSATENGRTRTIDYDPAGNEQTVGSTSFSYSPRNSLETADGLRYIYDGTGVRVAQVGLAVGPIITEQPQSRSICPGASATLSVRASGASSYQWETSTDGAAWTAISGGNASTLTATPSATAYYRAVTSNAAGATTSDIATLTPVALATEPSTDTLYGDITKDGAVNTADATFLRAVLAGTQQLAVPSAVADLNADTKVDALDLALVTAYASSTITCLPQFPLTFGTTGSTAPVVATVASLTPVATQTSLNPTQYFFYTLEMRLLSHTTIQSGGGRPSIETDYIWFAGLPVAQESPAAPQTRFTFADHLGTPFLQTTHTGTPTWHVEYAHTAPFIV